MKIYDSMEGFIMKKISAYVITLGMLLTMLPNTAMPAAAAVRSSLTAEDSTQKSAIQGSWKELSGSMLTVHDDNAFILIDADGTYCKVTVKQEDNLNANISQLSGKWREAGALNRTLNIDVNGNYTLTNTDGTKSTGKAKIKLAEHGSGNQPELLYMLYNEKGNLELSFHSVSQLAISGGQDEVHGIRFVNSELVAKEADISYLSGKWNYEEQNTKNPAAYDAAGTITVAND